MTRLPTSPEQLRALRPSRDPTLGLALRRCGAHDLVPASATPRWARLLAAPRLASVIAADERLEPEDVFTPATPVSREMFATRRHEDLQDRVEGALREHGRQVVLYGDTGVGKTSLVRYLAEERGIPMVEVGCGPTYEDMLREALAQVIGVQEVEEVEKSSKAAEFGANLIQLASGRRRSETGKEVKVVRYPTSLGTAVAEAFRIMQVRMLFLDNFENLAAMPHHSETATKIVQLMKTFSDLSTYYKAEAPKIVVAGIPVASEQLLSLDEATGRRTAEIEVSRMPDDELDEILRKGEALLGIEFAGLCRERILYYSDGFPYYTHLFALESVRAARRRPSVVVELDDFEGALGAILANTDLTLRTSYENAVETGGEVKVRKSVLQAMAARNDAEVTFQAIREGFLELHRERYDNAEQLNFISPEMTRLIEDFGVLDDRGLRKSTRNRYRFKNPLMRAYVRLQALRERQGQLDV